jgi:AcrR family transcriptional regulator
MAVARRRQSVIEAAIDGRERVAPSRARGARVARDATGGRGARDATGTSEVRDERDGSDPGFEPGSTPARLLEAAERLFLEHGYDRVTARMINAEAGCNPAAIHYHFGSKEHLVAQLLEVRLLQRWHERRFGFTALEARSDPTVEEVVRHSVRPLARLVDEGGREQLYVHLLARVYLGHWDVRWRSPYFEAEPWLRVLARALPELDADELRTRWDFATRLNLTMFGDPLASRIEPRAVDADELIAFIVAALSAAPGAGSARQRAATTAPARRARRTAAPAAGARRSAR